MHILRNGRLIHKKLLILLVVTLLWWIADFALEFTFPTYLEGLGKSYFEIGLLLSIAAGSGLLVDLPMGVLSDKASRRNLMILGLSLMIVSCFMIFYLKLGAVLFISFALWGMAYQIWRVPRDAQFASQTDRFDRGQEYGLDIEMKYIGQSVGAILAGVIISYAGFHGIVSFYGVLLLIGIVVLVVSLKETSKAPISSTIKACSNTSALSSSLKEIKVLGRFGMVLICFAMLFMVWESVLLTFQPLFYGPDVLNIPPELGGLLMASFSIPGIVLSYPAGRMADKYGKRLVLTLGLMIIGASLILFSFSTQISHIFLFALLTSVGWVLSLPALNGLIIDTSIGQKRGCVVGLLDFFMDLGFVLGPLVGGLIAQLFGLKSIFLAIGSIFLASLVLFSLVRQDSKAE